MAQTCALIDGGCFQKVLETDFGGARLDFGKLGPVLTAGESGFIPAVQATKDRGARVALYHGRINVAHRAPFAAADERRPLDRDFSDAVRRA